jgi:hypothetical protein
MPIAGLWNNETITGVLVSLDTVDPNGNSIHIADVTTDGYSGTFGYPWQPDISGQYTVTATFMGDDAYSSSFATKYVSISETNQSTSPTPSQISFDTVNNTIITGLVALGIAIILSIAIVGVLLLRKRS